jgi:HlyD family secretion protein
LYKARLKQAQSSLDLINKKIEDSAIKSPIKGKVIEIAYEVGEQVSQTKPAISVLAENNFEIEVDISEADIAKIDLGDFVEITLDAFGEENVFEGAVSFIEPAETIIQDVIYYKAVIIFDKEKNPWKIREIKSGMTANVMITTDKRQNVLVVPSRAIVERDGKKIVRVMVGKKVEEVEVQTGLRGDGGYIEILDNIKEGDLVATFVKEVKKRDFRY